MQPSSPQRPTLSWSTRLCIFALLGIMLWQMAAFYQQYRTDMLFQSVEQALHQNDTAKATHILDTALESHSADPSFFARIVNFCQEQKRDDLGVKYARRALQDCKGSTPQVKAFLYDLLASALTTAKQGNYRQEALDAAAEALHLTPDDPSALNAMGYMLADFNQDLDKAQGYITRALKLISEMSDTTPEKTSLASITEDSYGWLLYRQGKYTEAIDIFNQAWEDLPDAARDDNTTKTYYYHQGAAYFKAGRIEDARRALQAALQYDPTYEEASTLLKELPAPAAPATPKAAPLANPASSAPKTAQLGK